MTASGFNFVIIMNSKNIIKALCKVCCQRSLKCVPPHIQNDICSQSAWGSSPSPSRVCSLLQSGWSWLAVVYIGCTIRKSVWKRRLFMLGWNLLIVNVTYVLIDNQELAVYWLWEMDNSFKYAYKYIYTHKYQKMVSQKWMPMIENNIF